MDDFPIRGMRYHYGFAMQLTSTEDVARMSANAFGDELNGQNMGEITDTLGLVLDARLSADDFDPASFEALVRGLKDAAAGRLVDCEYYEGID